MAREFKEGEDIRVDGPVVKLGSGAFGTVYRAEFREARGPWHPCALKLLNVADAGALKDELNALAALPPHPNIVRLIGVVRTASRVGIATELLPGGSLFHRLDECSRLNTPPSTETRLRWCLGVAAGLVAMHERNLVHGDIKTPNVMLDSEGPTAGAKLIDLGLVKCVHVALSEVGFAGTLNYSAPELIPDGGRASVRSAAADVYAFGCLCYSVFSRREPFHEHLAQFGTSTSKKLGPEVLARVGPLLRGDGGRVPLRPNLEDLEVDYTPEGLRGLLAQCWQTDHIRRPTIQQVLAALQAMPVVGSAGGGGRPAATAAPAAAAASAAPAVYGAPLTVHIKARGPGVNMGPYISFPIVSRTIEVRTSDTVQHVMDEATRATRLVVSSLVHSDGPVARGVLRPERTMASYDWDGSWAPVLNSL